MPACTPPFPPPASGSGGNDDPLGAPSAPRTRIFPFTWNETATSRRTISGERCRGPALWKLVVLGTGTYVAPTNKTLEIGIAATKITENGVALTLPRPYSLLLELQDPFALLVAAAGRGMPLTTTNPQYITESLSLDLVIYDAEFFPVVSLWNNTANAQQWVGHMKILEQIRLDKLGDYMGR